MSEFEKLREVVKRLRGPGGCPWDREQTHETLKPCLIEEAYEVLDAIDLHDVCALREELGDLLLQVLAHGQIAEESGTFSLEDVLTTVTEKLIRRHPHVFGGRVAQDSEEALRNWSEIKEEERSDKGGSSVLDGVPNALPALLKAQRVTEKASYAGFDWKDTRGVEQKILEEVQELTLAIEQKDRSSMEAEFGDLLLSLVNLARFLKIDSEGSLYGAVRRFEERFRFIEQELRLRGKNTRTTPLEEMEALWQQAKHRLCQANKTNGKEI